MGVEEALIALLLADSGVAAIAQDRVFPVSVPQGQQLPAATVARISGSPLYSDEGEVGLEDPRVQIDSWGLTYGTAKTLARAITARLSAFEGTVSGVVFQFVMLDSEEDSREQGANVAEYRYRTRLDFIFVNER